ncbi:MAG: ribonuclease P protein component [Deltaproteobacteria bacterium]|nr:ribonuclease P protein component [Deltaproteobacteria bacterium]
MDAKPTGQRFPKASRLLDRRDFLRVGRRGKRFRTPDFTVLVDRGRRAWPRVGLTLSRQSGKAVRRNRAKRLIREYYRTHRHLLAPGYDIVVIVRDAAALRVLADVESNFDRLFRHAPFLLRTPRGGSGDAPTRPPNGSGGPASV